MCINAQKESMKNEEALINYDYVQGVLRISWSKEPPKEGK